ncbi:MAG: FKBP-type peptidyl-prolyl cis-trans isomerase [Candidatus Woesearchaeota archaeon]
MRYLTHALVTILVLTIAACDPTGEAIGTPQTVQLGDTVSVEYTGSFPNGTVFDTSEGRGPLTVRIGAGQVIPGFEDGLLGLSLNERARLEIPPEQGYGVHSEEFIQTVSVEDFGIDPTEYIGEIIQVTAPNGQMLQALLIDVEDGMVVLDLNHRLAGETLIFDVEVVDIER